jgi:hypothetical protein
MDDHSVVPNGIPDNCISVSSRLLQPFSIVTLISSEIAYT